MHLDVDALPGSYQGQVVFEHFQFLLSVNSSCMEGPPVTIDWAHDPSTQFFFDVNTFERMRGDRRVLRELLLPKDVRERT